MKARDISNVMKHYLGVFEGLRRLGFESDDIYFLISRSVELGGKLAAYALLQTQGKEFTVFLGPVTNPEDTHNEYKRVTVAIESKAMPERELKKLWESSLVLANATSFATTLLAKGFVFPSVEKQKAKEPAVGEDFDPLKPHP